jgi:hypothetical protein
MFNPGTDVSGGAMRNRPNSPAGRSIAFRFGATTLFWFLAVKTAQNAISCADILDSRSRRTAQRGNPRQGELFTLQMGKKNGGVRYANAARK